MRDLNEILSEQPHTPAQLNELLAGIPLAELIDQWDSLEEEQKKEVFHALDREDKGDLLISLPASEQAALTEMIGDGDFKDLLQDMEPDDLVDFIQAASSEVRKTLWRKLSPESKREILYLLRFDEDDAAGLMTPRFLAVQSHISVSQALHFLRRNAKKVEMVYYIYVVDKERRLQGVCSLKDILTAPDDAIIENVMEREIIAVREDTDQEEVAKILETYDVMALPVVNSQNALLGIITFDDIIDVIREEQTEDVYKMGAMEGGLDRYLDSSIVALVKKRVPWLIILLLVGTITTNVVHHYESLVIGAAFLFVFMPVITQTGGNTGSQSSTLMIRGLATGEIHFRDIGTVMLKEILVGLIMGFVTGGVIILRSYLLPPGIPLFDAAVIGVSLTFVVVFSTFIGALAPLVIHRMGFDPTVMSAPLMATVIDVCGLTIYFETARIFLGL
ncbi:magnesium transporter [Marispirochaeta aestuarii]|uniref:Magnesium transporter MgtE n=1 Tax=Marispirochaeta aestuarii TaxID=1963862 RepID=A0A1Y1RUP9_9SPIO|nr:magnesium transporter [Marispirochaeta aestuarii]ORC32815.1 magnesium transporter [Marispirochaeta aestuarii]